MQIQDSFIFLLLNSIQSFIIQLQKKNANIWWTERNRISAMKFEAAQLPFLNDVFVAIAAVVA